MKGSATALPFLFWTVMGRAFLSWGDRQHWAFGKVV